MNCNSQNEGKVLLILQARVLGSLRAMFRNPPPSGANKATKWGDFVLRPTFQHGPVFYWGHEVPRNAIAESIYFMKYEIHPFLGCSVTPGKKIHTS